MNIIEAVTNGKRIRRKTWKEQYYIDIEYSRDGLHIYGAVSKTQFLPIKEDILATDWEIENEHN